MPASTNFLVFGTGTTNTETDAQYEADAARTGGAVVDTPFSSALANKAFYQWSTFITAFAEALVSKGFSPNDANLAALTSLLANVLTTADIKTPMLGVVYSPTAALNAATATGWTMTLDGNLAFSISGIAVGQILTFAWQQDSVGGRTITYPAQFYDAADCPQPNPTPNAVSILSFIVLTDGLARPYTSTTWSND
jgi:hypothetical protein